MASNTVIAAYYGLSPARALARLAGWFKWLGVRAVWDLGTARDLVLLEEAAEFMGRCGLGRGLGCVSVASHGEVPGYMGP